MVGDVLLASPRVHGGQWYEGAEQLVGLQVEVEFSDLPAVDGRGGLFSAASVLVVFDLPFSDRVSAWLAGVRPVLRGAGVFLDVPAGFAVSWVVYPAGLLIPAPYSLRELDWVDLDQVVGVLRANRDRIWSVRFGELTGVGGAGIQRLGFTSPRCLMDLRAGVAA